MPYLGDSPSNPVPLTLSGGLATGEASGAAETERHICWFSVPAQAAGYSVRMQTLLDSVADAEFGLVMVWDGGNTAHYVNKDTGGDRQYSPYRALPTGVAALIAVLPKGYVLPSGTVRVRLSGGSSGLSALTAAEWDAEFPPDLTKRLHAGVELSVEVEATAILAGTLQSPVTMNFSVSQDPQTFNAGVWERPTIGINIPPLPAGYNGLTLTHGSEGPPPFTVPLAETVIDTAFSRTFKLPPITDPEFISWSLYASLESALPVGEVTVTPVRVSDISGTARDVDGESAEPCNVLLFNTQDALAAVEAPTGSYTIPDVVEGDYIAVSFSRVDGRDVRARNVLVPPGTRVAGGGYVFPP